MTQAIQTRLTRGKAVDNAVISAQNPYTLSSSSFPQHRGQSRSRVHQAPGPCGPHRGVYFRAFLGIFPYPAPSSGSNVSRGDCYRWASYVRQTILRRSTDLGSPLRFTNTPCAKFSQQSAPNNREASVGHGALALLQRSRVLTLFSLWPAAPFSRLTPPRPAPPRYCCLSLLDCTVFVPVVFGVVCDVPVRRQWTTAWSGCWVRGMNRRVRIRVHSPWCFSRGTTRPGCRTP